MLPTSDGRKAAQHQSSCITVTVTAVSEVAIFGFQVECDHSSKSLKSYEQSSVQWNKIRMEESIDVLTMLEEELLVVNFCGDASCLVSCDSLRTSLGCKSVIW